MNNYASLKTSIAAWLNREGFAELEAEVDNFLAMAQRKIFWECNFRSLEASVDSTTATVALPADFLRVKSLYISNDSAIVTLKGSSPQQVQRLKSYGPSMPSRYYLLGTNIVFGPSPDAEYTYTLEYYKSLPLLSEYNTTNWFTDNSPELLLYAALVSACMFLKDDARKQVWEQAFGEVKQAIVGSEQHAGFEAGGLQVTSVN